MAFISPSPENRKSNNRNQIFRYIMEKGKTSHREISSDLNLSMPTVLTGTKELSALGLIQDEGLFDSTGGRKARILAPNPTARFSVGVDITANHISFVLVNMIGETIGLTRILSSYFNKPEYYKNIGDLLRDFITKQKFPKERLLGVGVSIPGIIDETGKYITDSHALKIRHLPCSIFSSSIPYPCYFINDANAASLAEMNANHTGKIVVYLSLSDSVGGAIIMNKSIYLGDNQRSGEFGHVCLIPDGKPCYCGKLGCFDAYCSALVLEEYGQGELEMFFKKVKKGDETCKFALNQYLDNLAIAIKNIRMAFDCDVIIGGYVGGFLDAYIDDLRSRVSRLNTFDDDGRFIHPCGYKYEASAVGAAIQHVKAFVQTV